MEIYIRRNRDVLGPFDFEAIQQGLDTGEILPTDSARFEGAVEWMPVSQLPGMRIQSSPVPPPIPPVVPSPTVRLVPQPAVGAEFEPVKIGCGAMLIAYIAVALCAILVGVVLYTLGGETAINVVYPSFLLGALGWIFFDAAALKTGRGQVAGMVNMPPWAWALAFFLFWLITLPIYLVTRPAIVKVNEQYPDGPPVTGHTPRSNGVLAIGVGCLLALLLALVAIAILTVIGKRLSETNPELRSTSTVVR